MVLVDGDDASVLPASDRGLAYGDGVFETIALVDGIARHWDRHLDRLAHGAKRLGIEPPDPVCWTTDLARLTRGAASSRAVLKLMLTRGSAGRGYAPSPDAQPRRISQLLPWPKWPASWATEGLRLSLCETRLAQNPALAGIKHLNRLEQVLAAQEVARCGADDGLMLAMDGRLIETTRANLFLVFGNQLVTPRLTDCGISGIMRDVLLDHLPQAGFMLNEADIKAQDLARCDEIFLTNALIGVWPVAAIPEQVRLSPLSVSVSTQIRTFLLARGLIP